MVISVALVALSVTPVFAHDHAVERVSVVQTSGSPESDGVELGDSIERVIEAFGEPETERTIFEGESSDGDLLALEWDGVVVQYFRRDDTVNYMEVHKDTFALSMGITIGTTETSVREALGDPHDERATQGSEEYDYVNFYMIRDESGMGGTEIAIHFRQEIIHRIVLEGFASSCF